MSAADLHRHLMLLQIERLEAQERGLTDCEFYRRDLEDEMDEYRAAYVQAAVRDIAVLRAELSTPLIG